MKQNPLITVIVPVYKVEKYLVQCVNSIKNQTYQNLEIILVDDGSPDECPQMCDEIAKSDSRIKVIHKENGGLSDARNVATAVAKGEYITFIDSDDCVNQNYIEILYNLIEENNAEISVCNIVRFVDKIPTVDVNIKDLKVLTNIKAMESMFYQIELEFFACCKMYKSEIVKNNPYPKGRLYEDVFTTYKMLFEAKKVAIIQNKLYYYRDNPNSIMNQKFTTRMFDQLDGADGFVNFVKSNCSEILPSAYSRKFSSYSQVLRWTKNAPNTPEIQEKRDYIWKFLKEYQWKMFADKKARLKNRLAPLVMIFGQKFFMKF